MWSTFKQRFSLKIFFLLYTIAYAENLDVKPFYVQLTTELPIGGDLGSSTSFAVCLAACFLHWKRLQNGNPSTDFDVHFKDIVKDYVIFSEKLAQDYECAMVDAIVCAHGKMVKAQFTNYAEIYTEMQSMINLSILLVDAKIRQRKCDRAKQMTKFKKLRTFDSKVKALNVCAIKMHNQLYKKYSRYSPCAGM